MIQSASTPELQTEFLRCLSGKPYFESTLGTHLHLFGNIIVPKNSYPNC